ncbi:MAG: PAS domain S-box protein [Desulfobacterales bacterium]|nr:PAS domain S-box protein [Desulfobacterales bacterium]
MKLFRNLSLKNKIFISTFAIIMLLSCLIGLFTRWVLINSLTSELKLRGAGIARGIAEGGSEFILTRDRTELTSLIYDARVGEKENLVNYIFVTDIRGYIIAHTFVEEFPENLKKHFKSNTIIESSLLQLNGYNIFDIVVSAKEGIYEIGRIHVGLNKSHIDNLIAKLRFTFICFLSLVTVVFFFLSQFLSKYITKPISELIMFSNSLSAGNYNINDYPETDEKSMKDEVWQLRHSFINMTRHIIRSQSKLIISEDKYRSLFAEGPNPVFVCEKSTLMILDANPAAVNKLGFSIEELIKKSILDFGNFDPQILFKRSTSANGKILPKIKEEFIKKDGDKIFVSIHSSSAKYENKDVLIIATPDISEIVEKDSQLIQASKMTGLGIMSASIAHELNQPLNVIKMGSEFLLFLDETGKDISQEEQSKIITEINGQVDRATEIINRLKEFGRKADFSRERVNVNNQIKSVLKIVEKHFNLQSICIELSLDENISEIEAHGNRIEQVVFNLLTNARDAINQRREHDSSDFKGLIRIESFMNNDSTAFTIKDNGFGIPDKYRDRIFEAFFTTKKMGEGMGMGLSIINGIVKDYNGYIEVIESTGIETVFKVKFPVIQGNL